MAQGDLPAATRHFNAGLKIAERLAASDPANAAWQRDLSVSLNKLGDLAVAQGDLPAATRHFNACLKIAERLAASDPANAAWQRDLSVSLEQARRPGRGPGGPARRHATLQRRLEDRRTSGGVGPGQRRVATRPVGFVLAGGKRDGAARTTRRRNLLAQRMTFSRG